MGRALVSNPRLRLGLSVMRGQFDDMLFEPLEVQLFLSQKCPTGMLVLDVILNSVSTNNATAHLGPAKQL